MRLFEWWRKRRSYIKQEALRQLLSKDLAFLFADFGAKFVGDESEYLPKIDTTIVTIEASGLRLKAVSFRDGFYMEVAPAHHPKQWTELAITLGAIATGHPVDSLAGVSRLPSYFPLREIVKVLRQRWQDLKRGLSEENFDLTQKTVRTIKEAEDREYNEAMYRSVEFHRQHPHANPWNKKGPIQTLELRDGGE